MKHTDYKYLVIIFFPLKMKLTDYKYLVMNKCFFLNEKLNITTDS